MRNKILVMCSFLFAFSLAVPNVTAQTQTGSSVVLIPFSSEQGIKIFNKAKYKVDFYTLANNFQSQSNGIVCGLATASIILNSVRENALRSGDLNIIKDKSSIEPQNVTKDFDPFLNRYTQNNIFDASYISNSANEKIKRKEVVFGKSVNNKQDFGFQIRQLDDLLDAHGLHSDLRIVSDDMEESKIKSEITKNLSEPNNYVIVNYKRSALGQKGGGHISPLGAYDKKSDSFLILDVNPSKAGWVWAKSKDLIAAMRTKDEVENRGYLLVSQ